MNKLQSLFAALALAAAISSSAAPAKPNFIIIFADDLGYGDLGCYGHPSIRTPNLDRMASEGMRFTDFYTADSVCTPSRSAILTGRLPVRTGMWGNVKRVLFPESKTGLPTNEITIAAALKPQGYATAIIGKWHLGCLPPFLPRQHGFDLHFGLPYSNDMDRSPDAPKGRAIFLNPQPSYFNVPLRHNEQIIERPADQNTLTRRYTEEAIHFIDANRNQPFFLYFAHSFPHVPLFASAQFKDTSPRGRYGDAAEEIDWSVGQVLAALRERKLADNTFVIFTSDNGPWLIQDEQGGSAGLLREGKGSTWEGGMREPAIAWWPGKIKAGGVEHSLASTLDMFPTLLTLAGVELPKDRPLDGASIAPLLFGTGPSSRTQMFYYRGNQLYAVRQGPFKAHYLTQSAYGKDAPEKHDPPLLFNLEQDPSENFNVAASYPEVLADIAREVAKHRASLVIADSQLDAAPTNQK